MSKKSFSHSYYIEEENMSESMVQIEVEDPNCKADCEIHIPFYLVEEFHRYLGERIEYLRNHNLLPHEK